MKMNHEDQTAYLQSSADQLKKTIEMLSKRHQHETRFYHETFQEIGKLEKERKRRNDKDVLARLRESKEYERSFLEKEPLVTVIIPTWNRGELIAQRTLPTVIAQDYENWEVIIVGDHTSPENCDILRKLTSPKVRFYNLKERGNYPPLPGPQWRVAGTKPANFGLRMSRGRWITHLDDDDAFTPNHISSLLSVALSKRVEWAHGQVLFIKSNQGDGDVIGSDPPTLGQISRISSLYHGSLKSFKYDPKCWKYLYPADWDLWERFLEMGVTHSHLPKVVGIHYGEADALEKIYEGKEIIFKNRYWLLSNYFTRQLEQNEEQLAKLQATVQSQQQVLAEKEQQYLVLRGQFEDLLSDRAKAQEIMDYQKEEINRQRREIDYLRSSIFIRLRSWLAAVLKRGRA